MRARIMNPNGQVVEVEGTVAEVSEYMRRTGGRQVSERQARPLPKQSPFAGYDSAGNESYEVLEGVVVDEIPSTAHVATPSGPVGLVDEHEVQRYFRSGW